MPVCMLNTSNPTIDYSTSSSAHHKCNICMPHLFQKDRCSVCEQTRFYFFLVMRRPVGPFLFSTHLNSLQRYNGGGTQLIRHMNLWRTAWLRRMQDMVPWHLLPTKPILAPSSITAHLKPHHAPIISNLLLLLPKLYLQSISWCEIPSFLWIFFFW